MKADAEGLKNETKYSGSALSGAPQPPYIKPGTYRHFKGNEYEVLCLASHSETLEQMVVYRALYGDRGIWVRPASMWNDTVGLDGKTFKRFSYIDESQSESHGTAK